MGGVAGMGETPAGYDRKRHNVRETPAGYDRKLYNVRMRMDLGGIKGQEQELVPGNVMCS